MTIKDFDLPDLSSPHRTTYKFTLPVKTHLEYFHKVWYLQT